MFEASPPPSSSDELSALVRTATPADALAISELYGWHVREGRASFELIPPTETEMARRIEAVQSAGLPYLIAQQEGRFLGFAYASPYRPRPAYRFAVEDSVYVAADAQGKGVGRALLHAVIEQATLAGRRQMIAVIGDSANAASIQLHRSLGFEQAGHLRSVGWKHDVWLDTLFMQRALGAGDRSAPIT